MILISGTGFGEVGELDKKDYQMSIERCKRILTTGETGSFVVLFEHLLPYRNQIATQCLVALNYSVKDKLINDTNCFDEDYHLQDLCVCSFPLKDKTLLLMFVLKEEAPRYSPLIDEMKDMKLRKKILLFQDIAFSYSEEIYLAKGIAEKISADSYFKKILGNFMPVSLGDFPMTFYPLKHISDFWKFHDYISEKLLK